MDNHTLHTFIKQVSRNIPDEDFPLLVSCASNQKLKKGEVILKEGESCRAFYLVEKGYLRTYSTKGETIVNLNFAFEGDFASNLKSVYSHEASEVTIEAGEDASVWIFDLDIITEEFDRNPQILTFMRRVAVYILLAAEEHSKLFKLYTPTERYRHIEENNPRLLQRVSLSQLASYLGIARETLSRIRAKRP